MENKQIDVLDILLILAKHKKFIIITVLIASILAVIYSLLVPQIWASTASILPIQNDDSGFSFEGSSVLNLGSSLLGNSSQTGDTELIAILESRLFSEDVIDKFNLLEYFEISAPDSLIAIDRAIELLTKDVRSIHLNEENGMINVTIKTKNKYLSSNISNYYCAKLEEYNLYTRMSRGKQKRIFIENRLVEVTNQIDSISLSIKEFQQKNNIIHLDEQIGSVIASYSDLVSQKLHTDIEYEYSIYTFDPNSPKSKELSIRRNLLKEKIDELEFSKLITKSKYVINIEDIPDLTWEYVKLQTKFEILNRVYEYLYPQLESAKIEEVRDLPTINVIDIAKPAGLRVWPSRAKLCIMTFIISLILSIFMVFLANSFHELKKNEIQHDKLKLFIKILLNK